MEQGKKEIHPKCSCGGDLDLIDPPIMQLLFGYARFECTKCKKMYKASCDDGIIKEY